VFFQNTVFLNAGVELGDTTADLISINGRVDTNIEPSTTLARNLGSASLFWTNLYTKNIIIKNAGSIESDGNILNLGSVYASEINIGTAAASSINIGSLSGTLQINNNNVILIGDLEIRGGDLTTNQTTFNLLNTVATTVNLGSSSTKTVITGFASIQSLILGYKTVSATTTLSYSDQVILASGASSYTISLPTAIGNVGKTYIIKCMLSSGSALTISAFGAELIDSTTTRTLSINESIEIISDGIGWKITSPKSASQVNEGLVSTSAQTFSGTKTFSEIIISNNLSATGSISSTAGFSGPGSVPIGSIIPIGDVGAWALPASGAIKDGWALCDGQTKPVGSHPSVASSLPNLTDDRFLQGQTSANIRNTGGSGYFYIDGQLGNINFSHSHTVNSHSHYSKHEHMWSNNYSGDMYTKFPPNWDTSGVTSSDYAWARSEFSPNGLDDIGEAGLTRNSDYYYTPGARTPWGNGAEAKTSSESPVVDWRDLQYNAGHGHNIKNGSGTSTNDLRPKYFNVVYLMRVK
jgi:hypothetical protein